MRIGIQQAKNKKSIFIRNLDLQALGFKQSNSLQTKKTEFPTIPVTAHLCDPSLL